MAEHSTGTPPPASAVVPAPRRPRPGRAPAVIAFALALAGAVAAFTPLAIVGAALLLPPALVLGIVSLARRARGTGMGVAALVLAVVGLAVSAIAVAGYFLAAQPVVHGSPYAIDQPPALPEASGAAVDAPALEPVALTVRETASGRVGRSSTWWFVAIVDAADRGAAAGVAAVDVAAVSPDGEVLETFSTYRGFLPGTTAVAGYFSDIAAGAEVAAIAVSDPLADPRYDEPLDACGSVEASDLTASSDPGLPTTVTGELSVRGGACTSPGVVVIARDADGAILEAVTGWAAQAPVDGTAVTFQAPFSSVLPADVVLEAHPLP